MKKLLIVGSILLLSISCATKQQFVVLRDVPQNPTFVVIPANNSLYQVEFGNNTTSALISNGVSVKSRPPVKKVRTERSVEVSEAKKRNEGSTGEAEQATLTEEYRAYEGLDADYMVSTFANSGRVQIEKVSTNEILASFKLEPDPSSVQEEVNKETLKEALESIGLKLDSK